MKPDLAWIADEKMLGPDLGHDLQRIFRNRPAGGDSFFVSLTPNIENPVFNHEPPIRELSFPTPDFRF